MRRSRAYPRRYSRRIKTVKYSNETTNATGTMQIDQGLQQLNMALIAPSNVQGTRKCKNFELSMSGTQWSGEGSEAAPVIWALVYVPEGTQPGPINLGALSAPSSLYEPSQNVIMSGIWPHEVTTNYRIKTRLARNLNSGDSIYLIMRSAADQPNGAEKNVAITLNYAIAY